MNNDTQKNNQEPSLNATGTKSGRLPEDKIIVESQPTNATEAFYASAATTSAVLGKIAEENNRAIEALSLRYNQIISKAEAGTRMEDLALHNDTINVIESEIESRRRLDTHITNTRSTLASLLQEAESAGKSLDIRQSDFDINGNTYGIEKLTEAFSATQNAMSLFRSENNAVQNIMGQMQQLISIAISLQQIIDKLDNESALRLSVLERLETWWAHCISKAAATTINDNTAPTTNATPSISWRSVGIALKSIPGVNQMTDIIKSATNAAMMLIQHTANATEHISPKATEYKREATLGDPMYYRRLMLEAESNADNDLLTPSQRKQAQKDYHNYRRLHESTRFYAPISQSTTVAGSGQNETDTKPKANLDRLRRASQYANNLEQTRIDIMADGPEKAERQLKLDNQCKQDALYYLMQADIEAEVARQKSRWNDHEEAAAQNAAANGLEYQKKPFSEGVIAQYVLVPGDNTSRIDAGNIDTRPLEAILAQYGLLQDLLDINNQKNQIEPQIKEAQQEQSVTDFMEMPDGTNIGLAFGEVSKLSKDTINQLIAYMEKYRQNAVETFDTKHIAAYEKALGNLYIARSDKSMEKFSGIVPEYFKQRKVLEQRRNSNTAMANTLSSKQESLRVRATTLRNTIDIEKKNGADTLSSEKELEKVKDEASKVEEALQNTRKEGELLNEELKSINDPNKQFKGICEGISTFASLIGNAASEAGSMLEALGKEKAAKTAKTVGEVANSVKSVADGFAKGGIVGGIATAAGEAMKWIGKIFSASDARKENIIKQLQKDIDSLQKDNEQLERRRKNEYSTQKSKTYDEEISFLEQQSELIDQQITEEQSKKKTDDNRVQQWRQQIEQINETIAEYKEASIDAVIGESISSSIDNFASALVNAWGTAADSAASAKDMVRSMLRQMVQEAMKTDLTEPVRRLRQMMAEAMDDNIVTDQERKRIEELAKEFGQNIREKYEWAEDIMNEPSEQQIATGGYSAQISEDTGSEISGYLAAIVLQSDTRNNLLSAITTDFGIMMSYITAAKEEAADTHDLAFAIVGRLEAIEKNTHELYEINEKLRKIELNTR